MSARYNRTESAARKARRDLATARPELGFPSDGFARRAPSSPHSAPIKVRDEATQRLIDEALARGDLTNLAAG